MKANFLFSSILIFFFNSSGFAQKLEDLPKHQYRYGDKLYKYEDMDEVFKRDPIAYPYFLKAKKNLKSSKTNGHITLFLMGAGTLAFVLDNNNGRNCSGFCITTGQAVGIITWIAAVPLMGTIALIQLGSGRSYQRKSVRLFNGEEVDIGLNKTPQLNLGMTGNGIGAVVRL